MLFYLSLMVTPWRGHHLFSAAEQTEIKAVKPANKVSQLKCTSLWIKTQLIWLLIQHSCPQLTQTMCYSRPSINIPCRLSSLLFQVVVSTSCPGPSHYLMSPKRGMPTHSSRPWHVRLLLSAVKAPLRPAEFSSSSGLLTASAGDGFLQP